MHHDSRNPGFGVRRISKLPPKHAARTNPDLVVQRTKIVEESFDFLYEHTLEESVANNATPSAGHALACEAADRAIEALQERDDASPRQIMADRMYATFNPSEGSKSGS